MVFYQWRRGCVTNIKIIFFVVNKLTSTFENGSKIGFYRFDFAIPSANQ